MSDDDKSIIENAHKLINETVNLSDDRISDLALEEMKSKKKFLPNFFLFHKNIQKKAIFLAGGAGAGKTEFSLGLADRYKIDKIEADELRKFCKYYNGANAHLFQKASSKGVSILIDYFFKKEFSFILDSNFTNDRIQNENINRAVNKGYEIEIKFIYRPLEVAKEYTKIREEKEGRKVLDTVFYEKFLSSIETVNKIKLDYLGVKLDFYNLQKNEVYSNIANLDYVVLKDDDFKQDIYNAENEFNNAMQDIKKEMSRVSNQDNKKDRSK